MLRQTGHMSPQLTFSFKRRDGHRAGGRRKADSGVSHLKREVLGARFPVHVVMRIDEGLPSLRTKHPFKVLRRAFAAGCDRFGFRLNHFSVLGGRVGPGRCRPGPPTDPDMRNSRIRLLRIVGSLRVA